MKKTFKFLKFTALCLLFTGLLINTAHSAAQRGSQQYSTKNFTKLSMAVPGDLNLKIGGTPSMTVKGNTKDIENLEVKNENGELKIYFRKNYNPKYSKTNKPLQIEVTTSAIEGISVNGSGTVKVSQNLTTSNLSLKLNGSGDIITSNISCGKFKATLNGSGDIYTGAVNCEEFSASLNGSGDIETGNVKCEKFSTSLNGSGDIAVKNVQSRSASLSMNGSGDIKTGSIETGSLAAKLSGSGDIGIKSVNCNEAKLSVTSSGEIKCSGRAKKVSINLNGSGAIYGKDLKAESVEIKSTGSGDVSCFASQSIKANLTGSCKVKCYGKPVQRDLKDPKSKNISFL